VKIQIQLKSNLGKNQYFGQNQKQNGKSQYIGQKSKCLIKIIILVNNQKVW